MPQRVTRSRAPFGAPWRSTISPRTYQRITALALVALGAIIVTGAAVRLTSSGMGCPTWPSCEGGSLVPRGATGGHGWIEFLNRVFTGIVSVAVILAVLGSLRRRPRRPDLTRWSWGLVAGVFAQALLGGLVVFLHVTPVAVAGHYLLSAVLVWNGVVLHHRASEPEPATVTPLAPDEHPLDEDALALTAQPVPEPAARPARRPLASPAVVSRSRVVVALAAVVLLSGTFVTGSGPHGGDEAADRLPFAVLTVVRIHSVVVWAFLAATLVLVAQLLRGEADAEVVGRGKVLLALIGAQGALGYLQYFTGVPELLVGGHVLGSVLVWVAALRFHLGLTAPVLPVVAPRLGPLRSRPVPRPAT